jgi:MoaA/NifB/PqqE/SkfB family radical SAM enzyme
VTEPAPGKAARDALGLALDEIAIEVTVHCNLRCRMCAVWEGARHGPEGAMIRSLLTEARELGATSFVPCGAEPFMRPDFVDLLEHAQALGYRRVEVVTNGLLAPRHLDRLAPLSAVQLHVSLDGPREVHDALRGEGVYDRAVAAAREARARGVALGLSGVLMRPTLAHIDHVLELAVELGLGEVSFQPFQPEIHGFGRDASEFLFAPDQRAEVVERIDALRERAATLGVRIYTDPILDEVPAYCFEGRRPIPPGGCFLPSRFVLVDVSGDLYPCFFMRDTVMGNVGRGDRLSDVWHSEAHTALQMLALTSRCPGCLAACSDIATFGGGDGGGQ